jgi:uncharacterized alkaline shock family protein YloU
VTLVVASEGGTVTVPDGVLVGIAVRATEGVEGLRVRRRRTIELDARVIRLTVAARRGEPLVELGERAQEAVAGALRSMCGLDVIVDVAIEELL